MKIPTSEIGELCGMWRNVHKTMSLPNASFRSLAGSPFATPWPLLPRIPLLPFWLTKRLTIQLWRRPSAGCTSTTLPKPSATDIL